MQGIKYYFNNGNIEIKKCDNSVHSSKAHFHNEVSIGLVEKGSCRTEINGMNYELTEKTILMIPSALVHKCNPENYNQWNFRMFYINPNWLETAFNNQKLKIEFSYIKTNPKVFSRLISLFDDIENRAMGIENESRLLNYISVLLNIDNTNYKKEITGDSNTEKMHKVKRYLEGNYLSELTLDDLAKVAKLSKYFLIRQFHDRYGLSPHKYITNLRINYAKNLLKKNKDFANIALESGFYDQSHFTKCFKEYTGVTPMKYKSYA